MRNLAAVGLGSNLGNREANLKIALDKLDQLPQTMVLSTSPFYETEPVDYKDQAWFINAAVVVETSLEAEILLQALLNIENEMLRKRDIPRGPRNIDLDLLLYADQVFESDQLILPHPEMTKRRFVLEPLCTVAADWIHPLEQKSIAQLLKDCSDKAVVKLKL